MGTVLNGNLRVQCEKMPYNPENTQREEEDSEWQED